MKKYLLKNKSRFALLISFWFFSYVSACAQVEIGVIQLDIKNLLNARPVSTFQDGKITSWNIGIDGNGEADGYLTFSAANFMGNKDPKALPDNPLFPANLKHPEILLHYSNSNTTDPQALAMKGISQFTLNVPSNFYQCRRSFENSC